MQKRIVLLGSTGSIGENVLRIVEDLPERFRVVGLAAARNADRVAAQAAETGASRLAMADPAAARRVAASLITTGWQPIPRTAAIISLRLSLYSSSPIAPKSFMPSAMMT